MLHAAFFPAQKATTAKRGLPLDFVNFGVPELVSNPVRKLSFYGVAAQGVGHPAHSSTLQPTPAARLLSNVCNCQPVGTVL